MSLVKSKLQAASRAHQATGKFLRTSSENHRQLKTALREAFLQREGLSEQWTLQNEYAEKMGCLPDLSRTSSEEGNANNTGENANSVELEQAIDIDRSDSAFPPNSSWDNRLWAIFSAIDVDGSGTLDVDELGEAFSALGFAPTRQQMSYIMLKYDVDHNDSIDFDEFKQMQVELETMSTSIKKEEEKQRLIVFDTLDEEGRGEISIQRLSTMIEGKHHSKGEAIQKLVRKYVPAGKSVITPAIFLNMYGELLLVQQSFTVDDESLEQAWLAKLNADSWKATISHMGPHALTVQHRQNLLLIFESLEETNGDGDRLGYISVASFAKFLTAMKVQTSRDHLRNLMAIYDAEKSGTIGFDVFIDLCKDMAQLVKEAEMKAMPGRGFTTMSSVEEEAIMDELRDERVWRGEAETSPDSITAPQASQSAQRPAVVDTSSAPPGPVHPHADDQAPQATNEQTTEEPKQDNAPAAPAPTDATQAQASSKLLSAEQVATIDRATAAERLKVEIEDLARAAVLDLPLDLRNDLAGRAVQLVYRQWVEMSWIQRYRMFRKYEAADERTAEVVRGLPAGNALLEEKLALQADLFRANNDRKGGMALLGRKIGKARILAAKGNEVPEALSSDEAKQRVMAYSVADRQEAAGLDAWDDALPWIEKLQLIRSIVALQQHRADHKPDKPEPQISYESLNRHWGSDGVAMAEADGAGGGGGGGGSGVVREESASTAIANVLFQSSKRASDLNRAKRRRNRRGRGHRARARLDFMGGEEVVPESPTGMGAVEEEEELDEGRRERLEKLKVFKKAAVKVSTMAQIANFAKDVHERIVARHFRDALLKDPKDRAEDDLLSLARLFKLCPQLKGLDEEKLVEFCGRATCHIFENKAHIVYEGDEPSSYYVMAIGYASVLMRPIGASENAEPIEVAKLGPGRGFGELGLVYDQTRSATVEARGKVVVAAISREAYLEILGEFHTEKLFKHLQAKLDFIRRFKAWRTFDLRPQFVLTFFLKEQSIPTEGHVLYDHTRDRFDLRYWTNKDAFPPPPDMQVFFLQSGSCAVWTDVVIDPEGDAVTEPMVVSTLCDGNFFGGPATPAGVTRIVTLGACELLVVKAEDLLARMGPDIVEAVRQHCKSQARWIVRRCAEHAKMRTESIHPHLRLKRTHDTNSKSALPALGLGFTQARPQRDKGAKAKGDIELGRVLSRAVSRSVTPSSSSLRLHARGSMLDVLRVTSPGERPEAGDGPGVGVHSNGSGTAQGSGAVVRTGSHARGEEGPTRSSGRMWSTEATKVWEWVVELEEDEQQELRRLRMRAKARHQNWKRKANIEKDGGMIRASSSIA